MRLWFTAILRSRLSVSNQSVVCHSVALFVGSSTVGQSAGNSGETVVIQFAGTLLNNPNLL